MWFHWRSASEFLEAAMPNPFLKQQTLPLGPWSLLECAPGRYAGPAGPRATPWNYYSSLIKRLDGSDS